MKPLLGPTLSFFHFLILLLQGARSTAIESKNEAPGTTKMDTASTEIEALLDYNSGLIFYKDDSIQACFVESLSMLNDDLGFLMIPIPSEHAVLNSSLSRALRSDVGLQFCNGLPLYEMNEVATHEIHSKSRKRRQAVGYYNAPLGEARAQSDWNPTGGQASQAQVQGQVFGSGFFSGQAQTQNGGVSQSQVQLSGVGIRGQISSSSGNAQAQLALGNGAGSGQASGLGLGPSNSQVQVTLGQQGEETMASASSSSGGATAGITGGPSGGGLSRGPGGISGFGSGVPSGSTQFGYPAVGGGSYTDERHGVQNGFHPGTRLFDGSTGVNGGWRGDSANGGFTHQSYGGTSPRHTGQHGVPQGVGHLEQQHPGTPGMGFGSDSYGRPGDSRNGQFGSDRGHGLGQAGLPGLSQGTGYGSGLAPSTLDRTAGVDGRGLPLGTPSGARGGVAGGGMGGLNGHGQLHRPGFGSAGIPGSNIRQGELASLPGGGISPGTSGIPGSGTPSFLTPDQRSPGTANAMRAVNQYQPVISSGIPIGSGQHGGSRQIYANGYHGGIAPVAQSSTPGAFASASGIGQAQAQTVHFGYSGNGQIVPLRYEQSSQPGRGTSVVNGVRRYQDQHVVHGIAGQGQELQSGFGTGGAQDAGSGRTLNGLRTGGGLILPQQTSSTIQQFGNGLGSSTNGQSYPSPTRQLGESIRTGGGLLLPQQGTSTIQQHGSGLGTSTNGQSYTSQTGEHGAGIRTGGGLILPQQTTSSFQQYGGSPGVSYPSLTGPHGTGTLSSSGLSSQQQQPGTHATGYTNGLGVGQTPTGYSSTSTSQHGPRQGASTNGHTSGQTTYAPQPVNGYGTPGQQHIPGARNGQAYRINGYGQVIPAGQPRQTVYPTTTTITGGDQMTSGQNGFSPSYGVSRSTPDDPEGKKCTIITFSCTIVVESNGRAKICKPNAVTMNGNAGGGGGGGSQNGPGSKICCC